MRAAINKSLQRNILDGSKFNKYFENVGCQSTYLGYDDTDFTLKSMKDWSVKYQYQTEKISRLLKGATIGQTVANIHSFLYNFIQYDIDGADQMLTSPACAWSSRKQGIDCKSYSIFASTILLNLGIKHSFRKIKQPNLKPKYWSHVYVVIPENQNTVSKGGYYIVDATIKPNIEVPKIDKKDLDMSDKVKLRHYGLNAPTQGLSCAGDTSCGCGCDKPTMQSRGIRNFNPTNQGSEDFGMGFSFSDIGNITSGGLSCWGGTYDGKDASKVVKGMNEGSAALYATFNSALTSANLISIMSAANEILRQTAAIHKKAERTASKDWSSSCSKKATREMVKICKHYLDISNKVLLPYLGRFFDVQTQSATTDNSDYTFPTRSSDGLKKHEFISPDATYTRVISLEFKAGVTAIPTLEITGYVQENISTSGFNVSNFLDTLTDIATQVTGAVDTVTGGNTTGGNTTGGNTNGGNTNGGNTNGNGGNDNDDSGMSTGAKIALIVGGTAVVAGGAYVALNKIKKNTKKD